MRILTTVVVLAATMLFSSCATLQRNPSFGATRSGQLILWDRSGAPNLLPPLSHDVPVHPEDAPHGDPIR